MSSAGKEYVSPSAPARTAITLTEVPSKYSSLVPSIQSIISAVPNHSKAYERLSHLCIEYGHRISGSVTLERVIDWMEQLMRADGIDNVHTEAVRIPHWVRGTSYGFIVEPKRKGEGEVKEADPSHSLPFHNHQHGAHHHHVSHLAEGFPGSRPLYTLSIGQSVSTPPEGITAPIVMVQSFEELRTIATSDPNAVKGRVVFYNCRFSLYGDTVKFRTSGAVEAEKYGAVGTLVRSVGPQSLYTPHTGTSKYASIPAFCIPIEDADVLAYLYATHKDEGKGVIVHLFSSAANHPAVDSRNIVGELRGREKPDEVIVIGAHIDSWDVGQGAHDDGQGCFVVWEAVRILKEIGMIPKRTIRVVLFTDEENRSSGAWAFKDAHKTEVEKIVAAMETDVGCYTAIGFAVTGSTKLKESLAPIASLLSPLSASTVVESSSGGVDVTPLINCGVPGLLLQLDWKFWDLDYFNYHHTNADTIDKIDPKMLIQNIQVFACMVWLLAEVDEVLPRGPIVQAQPLDDLEKFPNLMKH